MTAKVAWQIVRFNAGEFSQLMKGRTDYEAMQAACLQFINAYPLIQGPAVKRGGTRYIGEVKDSSKFTRLIEFEFSIDQAYVLEFGEKYIRFYRNYQQIMNESVVYEVETPYLEADLRDLYFAQINDILYIAHEKYITRQLIRISPIKFELSEITFIDGPYLPTHTGDVTFTPSGTSGTVTVTASVDTFSESDIGRHLRIEGNANSVTKVGWGIIKTFNNAKSVTVEVKEAFQNTAASKAWRLGVFSETTGWPSCVAVYEQRLVLAAGQRLGFSKINKHDTFSPTGFDGTVVAANGLLIELAADTKAHTIKWLSADDILFIGAAGADFALMTNTLQDALTPVNGRVRRISTYGSEHIRPIKIDDATLFVQRMGKKIRAFVYNNDISNYQGLNVTSSANHITESGVCDVAFTQEPTPIVWYVRKDGVLIGCAYDREQVLNAWHRYKISGKFQGGGAVVESVASIPSADMSRDDLYMIVKRTVNGQTKRYIEYVDRGLDEHATDYDSCFFVDCGKQYVFAKKTLLVNGLEHLEGETVSILADGYLLPDMQVKNGKIDLSVLDTVSGNGFSRYSIGLPYTTIIEPMPPSPGDVNGTSEGKVKKINDITLRFYKTIDCSISCNGKTFDRIPFMAIKEMPGKAELFSGDKTVPFPGRLSKNSRIIIKHDKPFPFTLEAIYPEISIS